MRVDEIRAMLQATQRGSSSGLSFGFKLLAFNNMSLIYSVTLFLLSLIFLIWLVKFAKSDLERLIEDSQGREVLRSISPYMMTYAVIWIFGDSFIYRMVILLPIVLFLSKPQVNEFQWPKIIQSAILVTCLSGKTSAILVTSSVMSLYFIFVVITIKGRVGPKSQISN